MVFTWQSKVISAAAAEADAETNWKHKVTPDWDDLITFPCWECVIIKWSLICLQCVVKFTTFRMRQYSHIQVIQIVDSTCDSAQKDSSNVGPKQHFRTGNLQLTPIYQLFPMQLSINSQLIPGSQIKCAQAQEAHFSNIFLLTNNTYIVLDLQYYLKGIFNWQLTAVALGSFDMIYLVKMSYCCSFVCSRQLLNLNSDGQFFVFVPPPPPPGYFFLLTTVVTVKSLIWDAL